MDGIFDLISKAFNINKPAAMLLSGGYLALAIAAAYVTANPDLGPDVYDVLTLLLAISFLLAIATRLPGAATTILACFGALLLAVWMALYFVQKITDSLYTPPLASADCILKFFTTDCAVLTRTAAVPEAELVVRSAGVPKPPTVSNGTMNKAVNKAFGRVFIQFAGYKRETVVAIARTLKDKGWSVEDADRGGERIGLAAGKFEVRYFNPKDLVLAKALAADMYTVDRQSRGATVLEVPARSVKGTVPAGHLELWISE
jgi:hypothetical protein